MHTEAQTFCIIVSTALVAGHQPTNEILARYGSSEQAVILAAYVRIHLSAFLLQSQPRLIQGLMARLMHHGQFLKHSKSGE